MIKDMSENAAYGRRINLSKYADNSTNTKKRQEETKKEKIKDSPRKEEKKSNQDQEQPMKKYKKIY